MNNYFRKFGFGWLIIGIALMLIYMIAGVLSASVLWFGRIMTLFFTSLVFILGPFIAGFLGFTRFFSWMLSWGVLVILNGLVDKYFLGAGAGGSEYLGPVMLLTLPLFLLIGTADEIRYKVKSRKI